MRETYNMESYSSDAARREWRRILNKVDHGERVEITRYGEPLAVVSPVGPHIYLLQRTDTIGYDEADGFVVAAESAEAARLQAAEDAGDEGGDTWLMPSLSTCDAVDPRQSGVILRSFRAG